MARWRLAVALAIGAVVPAVAGGAGAAETHEVTLRGVRFAPERVEIAAGDAVRWAYESGGNHTLTFDDGPDYHPGCSSIGSLVADCFSEGDPPIERRFETAGEFSYRCKVHGGMTGMVVVEEVAEEVAEAVSTTASSTSTTTRPPTTTTTARPVATTATTRPLRTSTTTALSTTTTAPAETATTRTPSEPPAFDPDDPDGGEAAGDPGGEAAAAREGGGGAAVPLIVALLLGVAAAGGGVLWRLRPGR